MVFIWLCLFVIVALVAWRLSNKNLGWSIGAYRSDVLFDPSISQKSRAVLTRFDIKDRKVDFVADPFVIENEQGYWLFFEVLTASTKKGDIAVAHSVDGEAWTYQRVVLEENFHLSYPQVIRHENDYYMIPETGEDQSIRLYKATQFPFEWELCHKLLSGRNFLDSTLVEYNGLWWINTKADGDRLYYAKDLSGPYQEHCQSPFSPALGETRNAGRFFLHDNELFRFVQLCVPRYGSAVYTVKIEQMDSEHYAESLVSDTPLLQGRGRGLSAWNAKRMHHINILPIGDQWLYIVDGNGQNLLRYYLAKCLGR